MIALIDSGVGGVNILARCVTFLPNDYVLLVDNLNAPYGNLSKKRLFNITKKNIDFLIKKYKIEAIILACNTLSFTIFDKIKNEYNIPIIKMQFDESKINKNKKEILFFATKNTIKNNKKLIDKNNWKPLYVKDLPLFIDNNINKLDNIKNKINKKIKNKKNINTIVLGCTHFLLIKKQLKEIFPFAKFYDNSQDVICELKKNVKPKQTKSVHIVLTRKDYARYVEFKTLAFRLIRGGGCDSTL